MENKENSVENLIDVTMSSLESMIDVNTVVGESVNTKDGSTILPVSKVTFGFASGGSSFTTQNSSQDNLPFGGGSGATVNIAPMAFLVVKNDTVKLLTIDGSTPIDKMIELVPDIVNRVTSVANKVIDNSSSKTCVCDNNECYCDDDDELDEEEYDDDDDLEEEEYEDIPVTSKDSDSTHNESSKSSDRNNKSSK